MNAPVRRTDLSAALQPAPPTRVSAKRLKGLLSTLAFIAFLSAILVWAILNRNSGLLTPKHGLGYWFGIAGASMMAFVLLYPLRKRIRFMRSWGDLPRWFRYHMVLGLLGPTLIMVHSNFSFQSTNALVALIAMLVVAGSGVVGRYLYVQIHRGLYGAKLEAKELVAEVSSVRMLIESQLSDHAEWDARLKAFESEAMVKPTTLMRAVMHNFALGRLERRARKTLLREFQTQLDREAKMIPASRSVQPQRAKEGRQRINRYFASVRKAGNLAVYERLFALWHVLHLPLIALLVVTTLIHIAAVNMY